MIELQQLKSSVIELVKSITTVIQTETRMLCRQFQPWINAKRAHRATALALTRSSGSNVNDAKFGHEIVEQPQLPTEDGPTLADFIGGVVPRGSTWKDYQGKLRRERGENER